MTLTREFSNFKTHGSQAEKNFFVFLALFYSIKPSTIIKIDSSIFSFSESAWLLHQVQSCLFSVLFSSSLYLPRIAVQEIDLWRKASRAFSTKSTWNIARRKNDETSKQKFFRLGSQAKPTRGFIQMLVRTYTLTLELCCLFWSENMRCMMNTISIIINNSMLF